MYQKVKTYMIEKHIFYIKQVKGFYYNNLLFLPVSRIDHF